MLRALAYLEHSASAILRHILNATHNFWAQLDIFMYIKAYSEYMAYSGIFRTRYIFIQLGRHCSGIYLFIHLFALYL